MTNAKTLTPAEAKAKRKLSVASPDAQAEALEQADEYESIFGTTPLELDNGDVIDIPPHPDYGMLDDEKMAAWDELMFRVDTEYEREPDIIIPEQRIPSGHGGPDLVVPGETQRGALRRPYRIKDENGNSKLVSPPHQIQIVQVALGAEVYEQLRKGGKNASDVWRIWNQNSLRIKERQQRDSKSAASALDMEAVSEADS